MTWRKRELKVARRANGGVESGEVELPEPYKGFCSSSRGLLSPWGTHKLESGKMKLKFAFYKGDSAISVEVARSSAGQVRGNEEERSVQGAGAAVHLTRSCPIVENTSAVKEGCFLRSCVSISGGSSQLWFRPVAVRSLHS